MCWAEHIGAVRALAASAKEPAIVDFRFETALVTAARSLGCRVVDGGTMAVGQAIGAFELFTGRRADATCVDAHFRRLVAQRNEVTP